MVKYRDLYYFGGNREATIQRDGEKCVQCSMSRAEHHDLYGGDITVDHIDGRGSRTPKAQKNNSIDNLQTLCRKCHFNKDVRSKLKPIRYKKELENGIVTSVDEHKYNVIELKIRQELFIWKVL